jgi:HAD superfamily phosphoserine phosphatase-like hydrolase
MKYKSFSPELWDRLSQAIEKELSISQETGLPPIAAFDADGTLWDADLGESFFQWQIESKMLANLPEDPWKFYRQWKESGDPRPAYLWLAQINQNFSLEQVRDWAEQAVVGRRVMPIFEDQQKLISILLENCVQVFVVTASVKWAVEPGARRLGLSNGNVIGVQTKIENGLITDEQDGAMTYREGKVQALLEKTNGRVPFLACGNTMGDWALLKSASQLGLAVGAAKPEHELFSTEEKLRQEAKNFGWSIHQF